MRSTARRLQQPCRLTGRTVAGDTAKSWTGLPLLMGLAFLAAARPYRAHTSSPWRDPCPRWDGRVLRSSQGLCAHHLEPAHSLTDCDPKRGSVLVENRGNCTRHETLDMRLFTWVLACLACAGRAHGDLRVTVASNVLVGSGERQLIIRVDGAPPSSKVWVRLSRADASKDCG